MAALPQPPQVHLPYLLCTSRCLPSCRNARRCESRQATACSRCRATQYGSSGSGPFVAMIEASKHRGRDDAPVPLWRARPGWQMEGEGPMGTRLGGRGDERLDDPLQVPRVERNDVSHARASERPDPALGHGIRVRSPHRCPDRLTPKPLRPGHAVAVSDQRARAMVPGRGLDPLLPGPGRRGMGRDGDGLDAAPRMRDEEEDVHRPDRARRDGAAVRRPEDAALVGEDGPPALRRRPPHGLPPERRPVRRTHGGTARPPLGPAGAGDSSRSSTSASRCDANARPYPDGGSPGTCARPTSDGGGAPSADDRPRSRAGGARTESVDGTGRRSRGEKILPRASDARQPSTEEGKPGAHASLPSGRRLDGRALQRNRRHDPCFVVL